MAIRVAINGMGVIGREMFRTLFDQEGIEIVFISDNGITSRNLEYLLKYDSVYHDFKHDITSGEDNITVNSKTLNLYNETDPRNLPLGECNVDVVLECTGLMGSKEKLQGFIDAGARKVIACYSAGNNLPTIACNVNQDTLRPENNIISIPQMETQAATSILKIINTHYPILGGTVKAYRSYTNAQPTLDSYNEKDYAMGRSASGNITPVNDPFSKSIGLVIPELNGKIDGFAYRSPVINGSILDVTVVVKCNSIYKEELAAAIKSENNDSMQYNEEQLCSSDAYLFNTPQVIYPKTKILQISDDKYLVSVSVIYDNIRGYCNQMRNFLKWASNNWLKY